MTTKRFGDIYTFLKERRTQKKVWECADKKERVRGREGFVTRRNNMYKVVAEKRGTA